MEDKAREGFRKEFNTSVGNLLASLRKKSGLSLEQVAAGLAKSRLQMVMRLEAGEESLHGEDLMELVSIYGENLAEVSISIQEIARTARINNPITRAPIPGDPSSKTDNSPDLSPNTT